MGGMLAAIESGWVQHQIHESAYRWQREVESGERVVVGVNRFAEDASAAVPPFKPDPHIERARARMLAAWRSERPAAPCRRSLATLERAARGSDNLVPVILDALLARATLGEVCDAMRRVFGTYRPEARL
jgi:methylmalonyl-CoA mutase N-terminal domain/subunit